MKIKFLKDFRENCINWSIKNGIASGSTFDAQAAKLIEEEGELATAVRNKQLLKIADAIGDIMVVICVIGSLDHRVNVDIENTHINYYAMSEPRDVKSAFSLLSNIGQLIGRCLTQLDHVQQTDEVSKAYKLSVYDLINSLMNLASLYNLDFGECLDGAWSEIKDRQGLMKDGIFYKKDDFTPEMLEEWTKLQQIAG